MNTYERTSQVIETIEATRIAQGTKESIRKELRSITKGKHTQPANIEQRFAPGDLGSYYDAARTQAIEAHGVGVVRGETPVEVRVQPVNIDAPDKNDYERHAGVAGWFPRIEVQVTTKSHVLVGDITKDDAIRLAGDLLAAAQFLR